MTTAAGWTAGPGRALHGEVVVPGDKSVSHRAIMLGAIADGVTRIEGFLEGEDTRATAAMFRQLGVRIDAPRDGLRVVHGVGLHGLQASPEPLQCGNAGTAMRLMTGLLDALGATVMDFTAADKCCGSYQVLGVPAGENKAAAAIINLAAGVGIEALATSCPLCEYNLGKQQGQMIAKGNIAAHVPTYYFTQLLAVALGLDTEKCHFELNDPTSAELLQNKKCLAAA